MCSLLVLEARRPKSRCGQGRTPLKPEEEAPSCLSSFRWWLAILGVPRLVAASFRSHGLCCVSVSVSKSPSPCKDARHRMGACCAQDDLVLPGSHLQRPTIRSHSRVPGVRTRTYSLGGTVQPTTPESTELYVAGACSPGTSVGKAGCSEDTWRWADPAEPHAVLP